MNIKKHQWLRYTFYWLSFLFNALLPMGIVAWQFGLFRNDNIFTQITSMALIGLIFVGWYCKDEALTYVKGLENKGWYKGLKRFIWLTIIFLIVLVFRNFIDQFLWVIGAFAIGALLSALILPIHAKHKALVLEAQNQETQNTQTNEGE